METGLIRVGPALPMPADIFDAQPRLLPAERLSLRSRLQNAVKAFQMHWSGFDLNEFRGEYGDAAGLQKLGNNLQKFGATEQSHTLITRLKYWLRHSLEQ